MRIDEAMYKAMPTSLQRMFLQLPNPARDEVLAGFPITASGGYPPEGGERTQISTYGKPTARGEQKFKGSEGSAARFFYCAKASGAERDAGLADLPDAILARSGGAQAKADRGETIAAGDGGAQGAFNEARIRKNNHPTVKPIDVGRWLQRMVTPPGGTTVDLFMGSGSFGVSAVLEGFNYIGMELDEDADGQPLGYMAIATARTAWAHGHKVELAAMAAAAQREADFKAAQLDIFA